jgi:flavin reductase (DIM6/NTAB) family NADH-FMN oxidoreductase RutF
MNVTAIEFPPETSELPDAGLTTAPSGKVSVPRIAESPVALECRMQQLIPLGGHTMLLAAVQTIYVRDDCVENEERYYIDTPKLELVGRMHGRGWYAKTTDLVQVSRIRYIDFQASKNAVE